MSEKFVPSESVKMLADYVLIEQLDNDLGASKSVIVLPESSKGKTVFGKVLAAGPGAINENGNLLPMTVQVGQTVMYRQWAGTEVEICGSKYMTMKLGDIIAIISGLPA